MAALAPEADAAGWEEKLNGLRADVARLGQVNLAAIDELKEQTERKEYLDRQYADLTDALSTLEEAMRKIDKETRTRFEETFEKHQYRPEGEVPAPVRRRARLPGTGR